MSEKPSATPDPTSIPSTRVPLHRLQLFAAARTTVLGLLVLGGAALNVRSTGLGDDFREVTFTGALVLLGLLLFVAGGRQLLECWVDWRDERQLHATPVLRGIRGLERLDRALDYLPEDPPPGWSTPFAPEGASGWLVRIDGGVVLTAVVVPSDFGHHLLVMLWSGHPGRRVDDATAGEILRHFRDVTGFVEALELPEDVAEERPSTRVWIALTRQTVENLPKPKLPQMRQRPSDAHLDAARRHLPARFPLDWSAPVALTGEDTGHGSAWMIECDDVLILTSLVADEGRAKLAVMLLSNDDGPVTYTRAVDILRHFRHVREFVPADAEVGNGVPGARMYLGEIRRTEMPTLN